MCCSLNNLSLVHISFISVLIYIYRPGAAVLLLIFSEHFGIQSLVICDECSFSFMVLKSLRGNLIRFAFIWVICPSEMRARGCRWRPNSALGAAAPAHEAGEPLPSGRWQPCPRAPTTCRSRVPMGVNGPKPVTPPRSRSPSVHKGASVSYVT